MLELTSEELGQLMAGMKGIFDVVRVVDPRITQAYDISPEGVRTPMEGRCHDVWGKGERCENCVSAKVLGCKRNVTKFEFAEDTVMSVVATPVMLDGELRVLETVAQANDDTLFAAYGHQTLIDTINLFNDRRYLDRLTGAYNRAYYEDQVEALLAGGRHTCVCIDVDKFKGVNDTFGHEAGDAALSSIAQAIRELNRSTDLLVRMGGDEFMLVLEDFPASLLRKRLVAIQDNVRKIVLEDYPELHLSISMGAAQPVEGVDEDLYKAADDQLYAAKRSGDSPQIRE